MRTENELMNLILQIADSIEVEAIALSGSRTNPQAPKDEFQDYDVVYIVENLNDLLSDLSWLDQFGMRLIEQHNVLGHRRLYLMLFEDGNRIDLTLCPKESIQEWVDSEAGFKVLKDDKGLFDSYIPSPKRYWTAPPTEEEFAASCNEFWWVSAYVVKAIRRNQLIYATDHLYGICQQELLKVLSWQVTSERGSVDIGKNYKYLFQYLSDEQEKEFSALLDLSSLEKNSQSLFATMNFFHREASVLAQKMGFKYEKEVAEKMMRYAKEKLPNHSVNKEHKL
ncbi:aminoglycoside 6-adenylyltransferase [Streptococcus parasanguinis]|uniref:aminoglycoside 6-adenylyltransferase n=1 Tax=Streptococcus parasanguinis TaxID=1318 RepID=UPI000E51E221|nr:aminoglycoside 6-adenylyltransferase [Streptococcus parasanguinis]RHF68421.1 aminoglycoside 6-adenylyltransferase [Streptococcus parasanguinis]